RDGDKIAATGLEVEFTENGTPVFPQSRLILECKKIYSHDLDRNKFSDTLIETYSNRVFEGVQPHTIYYGEIIGCWAKK
ncbi:MAG: flavin reductase family protein, partial [Muribaculaceae bacterium]|nr:flavin reductase family protein [Muribaculaceae bacterium]